MMTEQMQAGWYADPQDPSGRRYWDGQAWTDQVAPGTDIPQAQATTPGPSASTPVASSSGNSPLLGVGIIVALVLCTLVGRAVLSSGGGGGGNQAAYCSTYPELAEAGNRGDTEQARSVMAELARTAPSSSIRDDAALVVDAYDKVLAGQALSVDETKVTAAVDRIDAYSGRTCS